MRRYAAFGDMVRLKPSGCDLLLQSLLLRPSLEEGRQMWQSDWPVLAWT
jgi:hypothetical protein